MAEEERDKESRANNVILYRVDECESREERSKHDKQFCIQLFNDNLEVDVKESDFKSVFRIGKFQPGASSSVRPILVQFNDKTIKNQIMQSLSKLKNCEEKFKKVSITHDMTKAERAECKSLVETAKQNQTAEQSGEYIYRVRGHPGQMKIIKIKKK